MKIFVEPTGCLSLAGAKYSGVDIKGKKVGIIISGGNIDINRFSKLIFTRKNKKWFVKEMFLLYREVYCIKINMYFIRKVKFLKIKSYLHFVYVVKWVFKYLYLQLNVM